MERQFARDVRCAATRCSKRSGGFTLIELIAVLAVIGIIAAVAVPSIANAGQARQSAAARMLYHDLLFARQYAVASGSRVWVELDSANDRWLILVESSTNPGRAHAEPIIDAASGGEIAVQLGSGDWLGTELVAVDFDEDEAIGFDWLGRPINANETDMATDGSITLGDDSIVTVAAGTGLIRLTIP